MEASLISLSLVLVLLLFAHTTDTVDVNSIFILAGQSNMSGRGLLTENSTLFDPNPLIQRFSANDTWEEAKDPLHSDIDLAKQCGRGPGMPFANTLLQREPSFGVIGLVPCAIGDTSISQWTKGSADGLYETMLTRARAAAVTSGGVLRGLLWFQGEKDTGSFEAATMYKARFEQFVNDVRDDLQMPWLPVVEVGLPQKNEDFNNTDTVRAGQFGAAAELQHVRCVDARGCTMESGPRAVHLTSDGQRLLGTKMADAFLTLLET